MKNLELKATFTDFRRARRILRMVHARREPRPLVQADWYFTVPRGRLKLRRRKGERGGEVIFYVRPDAERPRASEFQPLPTADAAHMLRLLRAMFTLRVCVRKRRELWLLGETRIHLDQVDGLGRFLEIEVPVTQGIGEARGVMRMLVKELAIDAASVLGGSYADLLARRLATRKKGSGLRAQQNAVTTDLTPGSCKMLPR